MDVRPNLTSVLKNVERKLPKPAGLSVSEHQELLPMSALALSTKPALKMPQRLISSDSTLCKPFKLSPKNDPLNIIIIIYHLSLASKPAKDGHFVDLTVASLLRNKLGK